MHDTAWLTRTICREYGSLSIFAAGIRLLGHPLMSEGALRQALAGTGELWDDEVDLIAQLIEAPVDDVRNSLRLARIDAQFSMPESDHGVMAG